MAQYKYFSSNRYMYSVWVFLISLDISLIWDCECTTPAEVDKHLQMGMQLLAQGQLQDALSHLHAAIDGDPNNYISYYRRATIFLALGKARMGLHDLESTLKFKPDFIAARVQKASVLVKLGRLDEAYIEIEKVLSKDSNHEEANKLLATHERLKELHLFARESLENQHHNEAVEVFKEIIELSPWDALAREMRSDAYATLGDRMSAISDLRTVTKLTQDNTECFFRLSTLYYQMGDTEFSLSEIRECLKLDPEHKKCFPLYKKVKKIVNIISNVQELANNKNYEECVSSSKKILKVESTEPQIRFMAHDKLCQCQGEAGDPTAAIASCNEALRINNEARIYCDRAEVHILNEDFDDAIKDFKIALELNDNLQTAKEGLSKAQKLKKQAGRRDYYKILGVKRNAKKSEITKAYRALAQKWHPDKYTGEEKEKAENKFIDIAAAKEVLTDKEKRAKFDQGEDPLDPEQQQNGGFNPFGQHFFRQRGGGFPGDENVRFKFHFN